MAVFKAEIHSLLIAVFRRGGDQNYLGGSFEVGRLLTIWVTVLTQGVRLVRLQFYEATQVAVVGSEREIN